MQAVPRRNVHGGVRHEGNQENPTYDDRQSGAEEHAQGHADTCSEHNRTGHDEAALLSVLHNLPFTPTGKVRPPN